MEVKIAVWLMPSGAEEFLKSGIIYPGALYITDPLIDMSKCAAAYIPLKNVSLTFEAPEAAELAQLLTQGAEREIRKALEVSESNIAPLRERLKKLQALELAPAAAALPQAAESAEEVGDYHDIIHSQGAVCLITGCGAFWQGQYYNGDLYKFRYLDGEGTKTDFVFNGIPDSDNPGALLKCAPLSTGYSGLRINFPTFAKLTYGRLLRAQVHECSLSPEAVDYINSGCAS